MTEPNLTEEQIEQQAIEAAHKYTSVNDACPYSFYGNAGQVFKRAFQRERVAIVLRGLDIHKAKQT